MAKNGKKKNAFAIAIAVISVVLPLQMLFFRALGKVEKLIEDRGTVQEQQEQNYTEQKSNVSADNTVFEYCDLDFIDENDSEIKYQPVLPQAGLMYNQLNTFEKTIYNALFIAAARGDDSVKASCAGIYAAPLDAQNISRVDNAFWIDHPEYYFIRSLSVERQNDDTFTLYIEYFDFWKYDAQKDEHYNEFIEKAEEITAEAEKRETDFEKALFVHDYFIANAEYAHEELEQREKTVHDKKYDTIGTAYACIIENRPVCAGYALAYSFILNNMGIDCTCIIGKSNGEGHMWNCVKLDGSWYYLDLTWDDFSPDDGNGNYYLTDDAFYDYCFITADEIGRDHTSDRELFYIPDADSTENNYFVKKNYYFTSADFNSINDCIYSQYTDGKDVFSVRFDSADTYKESMKLLRENRDNFTLLKENDAPMLFLTVFESDNILCLCYSDENDMPIG